MQNFKAILSAIVLSLTLGVAFNHDGARAQQTPLPPVVRDDGKLLASLDQAIEQLSIQKLKDENAAFRRQTETHLARLKELEKKFAGDPLMLNKAIGAMLREDERESRDRMSAYERQVRDLRRRQRDARRLATAPPPAAQLSTETKDEASWKTNVERHNQDVAEALQIVSRRFQGREEVLKEAYWPLANAINPQALAQSFQPAAKPEAKAGPPPPVAATAKPAAASTQATQPGSESTKEEKVYVWKYDGTSPTQADIDAMPEWQRKAYLAHKGTSEEFGIVEPERIRRQNAEIAKAAETASEEKRPKIEDKRLEYMEFKRTDAASVAVHDTDVERAVQILKGRFPSDQPANDRVYMLLKRADDPIALANILDLDSPLPTLWSLTKQEAEASEKKKRDEEAAYRRRYAQPQPQPENWPQPRTGPCGPTNAIGAGLGNCSAGTESLENSLKLGLAILGLGVGYAIDQNRREAEILAHGTEEEKRQVLRIRAERRRQSELDADSERRWRENKRIDTNIENIYRENAGMAPLPNPY